MSTLTSPVTWALVGTFVFGGLNEVVNLVPSSWAIGISLVITALGVILHKGQIAAGKVA